MGEKDKHRYTAGGDKIYSDDELIQLRLKDLKEQKESIKQHAAWESEAKVKARDLSDVVDEAERALLRDIFSVDPEIGFRRIEFEEKEPENPGEEEEDGEGGNIKYFRDQEIADPFKHGYDAPGGYEVRDGHVVSISMGAAVEKFRRFLPFLDRFSRLECLSLDLECHVEPEVPRSIFHLPLLRYLIIKLEKPLIIPDMFDRLKMLKKLYIFIYVTTPPPVLPASMGTLEKLECLSISTSEQDPFPEWLGSLAKFGRLKYLHIGGLKGSRLVDMPEYFKHFTQLQFFWLSANLSRIPDFLLTFRKLVYFMVFDDALRRSSPAIQAFRIRLHGNVTSTSEYWRQRMDY
jgi:hypothetical protein